MLLLSQQQGAPGSLGGVVTLPWQPSPVQHELLYDSYQMKPAHMSRFSQQSARHSSALPSTTFHTSLPTAPQCPAWLPFTQEEWDLDLLYPLEKPFKSEGHIVP